MIIANLMGGLGNQMFQYAAGLAISDERHIPLMVALDMFKNYDLHNGYELRRVFNIKTPIADYDVVKGLLGWRAHPIIRRVLGRTRVLSALAGANFITESLQSNNFNMFKSKEIYIHGYWQSERYFVRCSDTVRSAFSFVDCVDAHNEELLHLIRSHPSASVHIRRGDYLSRKNSKIYCTCSPHYYLRSMAYVLAWVPDVRFYVFTDDPIWAQDFFSTTDFDVTIVSNNMGIDSYKDMMLMSNCQHNIIANSSFSWWGAWLNANSNKIVIAPKNWLHDKLSSEIVPSQWLMFDNQ